MAFWNRSRTPEPPKTFTNAPSHWPPVALTQFDQAAVSFFEVLGTLPKVLEPAGATFSVMRAFVYDDGILQVPMVVEEGATRTAVFVYASQDTRAAARYSGVRTLLRSREGINAVYYGPSALAPVAADPVLKPLDTPMFSKFSTPPTDGSYALWWATPEDPRFSDSLDRALLDRWFEALDGYGFALCSLFARALELVASKDDAPTLVRLPEQPFLLPVCGPGDMPFMLHAAAGDGMFLAFDRSRVNAAQRHTWLRLLVDLAERCRGAVATLPADPQEGGLTRWREIRDDAIRQEQAGDTDLVVHEIALVKGQPMRSPQARSGRTRAATPVLPPEATIEFGLAVIDRTVARLRDRAVEASAPERLGQPNFGPSLVVQASGRRWERDFALDDFPVVLGAAARTRVDWPDAEHVAVLVDAAVTEKGQRVDAIRVLVEGADGAADVFQRYALGTDGHFQLVGRPTVTPLARFVHPADPALRVKDAAIDPALVALVDQALPVVANGVAAAAKVEGGSAPDDQRLRLPRAMVDRGDEQGQMVMFGMMGALTAQASCRQMLEKDAAATSIVFWYEERLTVDGEPQPLVRLLVQRRGDAGAAVVEQRLRRSAAGGATLEGPRTFVGWADSLFPGEEKAA